MNRLRLIKLYLDYYLVIDLLVTVNVSLLYANISCKESISFCREF